MPVKMLKSKKVPLRVGDTAEDILTKNKVAQQPEQDMGWKPSQWGGADPLASQYPAPFSQPIDPIDMLKSIPSGAVSMAESAAGQLGDLSDLRYTLAHYINDKMKGSSGMDLGEGIDNSQKYASANLPGTEDIASNVTDPLLRAMGPMATELGRYQPQTNEGKAIHGGISMMDPTEWLLPGGAAFKAAKRFF